MILHFIKNKTQENFVDLHLSSLWLFSFPLSCVTSFIGDDLVPINMINMIKLADLLIDIYLTYVNGCGAPGRIQKWEYYLNVLLYIFKC